MPDAELNEEFADFISAFYRIHPNVDAPEFAASPEMRAVGLFYGGMELPFSVLLAGYVQQSHDFLLRLQYPFADKRLKRFVVCVCQLEQGDILVPEYRGNDCR